jgi:hypothetical protein
MGCVTFRLLSNHKHSTLNTLGHKYNMEIKDKKKKKKYINNRLRYAKVQMVTIQCYRLLRDLTQELKVENNHQIFSQLIPNLV